MNLDELLKDFCIFIEKSLPLIKFIEEKHSNPQSLMLDWYQTNWECLVESSLFWGQNLFLKVYGEGAECNDSSSRVWNPQAVATHEIHCIPKEKEEVIDHLSGENIKLTNKEFSHFVSWDGKQYGLESTLDYVLLEDEISEYIVLFKDVTFTIKKIK